jgi:hypothetical protein
LGIALVVFIFVDAARNINLKWHRLLSLIAASAFAFVINIDSGVAAYCAAVGGLGYIGLCKLREEGVRALLPPAVFAAAAPAMFGVAIQGITFARTGSFFGFSAMFNEIVIFNDLGYFRLPMPLFHWWNLLALILLTSFSLTIGFCVKQLLKHGNSAQYGEMQRNACVFALSVLLAIMFTYYLGRSHTLNFHKLLYVVVVIAGMLAERLHSSYKHAIANAKHSGVELKGLSYLLTLGLVVWSLSFNVFSQLFHKGAIEKSLTQTHIANWDKDDIVDMEWGNEVLQLLQPEEKLMITPIGNRDVYLSLSLMRANNLANPSYAEILTHKELDSMLHQVESNESVKLLYFPGNVFEENQRDIISVLDGQYMPIASGTGEMPYGLPAWTLYQPK